MKAKPIDILIVEDDFSFAINLERMLSHMGYSQIKAVDNSADALDSIHSDQPDLIIMDIDIKGKLSGTDIGASIIHLQIPIIYLTSFDNKIHYQNAKRSNITAYLIKPVSEYTLEAAIEQSLKAQSTPKTISTHTIPTNDYILLKHERRYHKVMLSDIYFIEASNNYIYIHFKDHKLKSRITFKDLEDNLETSGSLIKVHRSFIISLSYFKSIDVEKNIIFMENGSRVPISRTFKKSILTKLKQG